jgi:hypothetical protein
MGITQGLEFDLNSITKGLTFTTLVVSICILFVQNSPTPMQFINHPGKRDGVDQVTGIKTIGR